MNARILCLAGLLTACSSVLGLDSSNYVSTEDQLCKKYESCMPVDAGAACALGAVMPPCPDLGTTAASCKSVLDNKTDNLSVSKTNTCLTSPDCMTFVECIEGLAK